MNGLTHPVVPAKRKRNVADAATDICQRKMLFNPSSRFEEVHCIVVMFLDTGCHGEDVRIENNILSRKADAFSEEAIGPLTNLNLAFIGIRLASFIERHHHHSCSIAMHKFGLLEKLGFTFFEADAVDHRLALDLL